MNIPTIKYDVVALSDPALYVESTEELPIIQKSQKTLKYVDTS
jgi:hypothetical protein